MNGDYTTFCNNLSFFYKISNCLLVEDMCLPLSVTKYLRLFLNVKVQIGLMLKSWIFL